MTGTTPVWGTCGQFPKTALWIMADLACGEPEWQHMPEHDVAALIGEEEMRAPAPEVPEQDDNPWSGVPPGL